MDDTNKLKRSDITINGNLATYSFRHEGSILGTYTGQFVFKCFLLPSERLSASKDRRALLGEFGVLASELDKNLALALTDLKYRIVSAPPFWFSNSIGGNIPDTDLIFNVFDAAMDSQEMFKELKNQEKLRLLESSQKAADAILAKKQEEKKHEEKTEEEEIEDELKEMDSES